MKLCLNCNLHYQDTLEFCPQDSSLLVALGRDPMLGKILSERYRILCSVGKGSMGTVYKAIQESTGREMAVKVLHKFLGANADSVRRFYREAKAVSRLSHPNIIRLYDFGVVEDDQPYIVTEFLKGNTLSQVVRQEKCLATQRALPIIKQVCSAVGEAHRVRIIHRDLKPDNIFLTDKIDSGEPDDMQNASKDVVTVLDFGVAKLTVEAGVSSASVTVEGKVCGSPAYMSPEQCRGSDVDWRSDIYSLGVVVYEALTGMRPFSADDVMGLMFMHVNKQPPSMAAARPERMFPIELETCMQKALSKNPNDRQQSAEELWEDVDAACHGRTRAISVAPVAWIPFDSGNRGNSVDAGGVGLDTAQDFDYAPDDERLTSREFSLDDQKRTGGGNQGQFGQEDKRSQSTTVPPADKQSGERKFTAPVKVEAEKVAPIKMALKSVATVALLILSLWVLKVRMDKSDAQAANLLVSEGRYEEGADILQRLQSQGSLSPEMADDMYQAYMQMASKRARDKKYSAAIDLLQRVPEKSRFYTEAVELREACQQHTAKED